MLLEERRAGNSRMKTVVRVDIAQRAFVAVLEAGAWYTIRSGFCRGQVMVHRLGNRDFLFPERSSYSTLPPLDAHICHLRHLSNPGAARLVLRKRFSVRTADLRKSAELFSAHIAQALDLYETAHASGPTVRPILQYYAYLNLAVAVILAYRPSNYVSYRQHGLQDRSATIQSLDLSSRVVEVTRGAIPLFHNVICSAGLPRRTYRLREIVVAIPTISVELEDAFRVRSSQILAFQTLEFDRKTKRYHSQFRFELHTRDARRPVFRRIPVDRLEQTLPHIKTAYKLKQRTDRLVIYSSKQEWVETDLESAQLFHRQSCFKAANAGGHQKYEDAGEPMTQFLWYLAPRTAVLPTMTASLMFAFVLASICRYRPCLVRQLEESRLNLLADVFVRESPGVLVPTFRNLLYKEWLTVEVMTRL